MEPNTNSFAHFQRNQSDIGVPNKGAKVGKGHPYKDEWEILGTVLYLLGIKLKIMILSIL